MLPENYFKDVRGFISWPEAELLYSLARDVPPKGHVVEIGSYQARSTIALAFGAKEAGALLWAIDPHATYEVDGTLYSMADNQAYYSNLADYGVGDVVKTINLSSRETARIWKHKIDLLWIDGDHAYEQVFFDWNAWSIHADKVAMHDTAGHHEGINRLVADIVNGAVWRVSQKVDAITVFTLVR